MAGTKRKSNDLEVGETKIWKVNPPGPEQRELNRLFENKTLDRSDTPGQVRMRHQMFMAFNPRVFAQHFRTTKAKYGLNTRLAPRASSQSNAANKPQEDEDDLTELYGSADRSNSPSLLDCNFDSQLESRNFPFMTWTYTNHRAKYDFVCVAVPTISGSRDIKFVVSDDGMKLFINYIWPSVLFNPDELFANVEQEDGTPLPMEHAKVYSYRNRLNEFDLSNKSKPLASLVVPLPIKVQRESGTYKKQGITCGETKVAMIQLTAYQKNNVINDADTTITF